MKNQLLKKVAHMALASFLLLPAISVSATETTSAAELQIPAEIAKYLPKDVKGHWAQQTLYDFLQAGIVNGYQENGTYFAKPESNITRAEFVKILVEALNLQGPQTDEEKTQTKIFTDVKAGDWYAGYVQTASWLGLINGKTEATFEPNSQITRGEITKLVVLAFKDTVPFDGTSKSFSDASDFWGKDYIEQASKAGVINGDPNGTTFRPNDSSTRAEAMVMLQRALQKENTALPDDSVLTDLVINEEKAVYEAVYSAVYAEDYAKIKDISAEFGTGFFKASNDFSADILTQITNQGVQLQFSHTGDWTASVVSKSNRYATVYLNGGTLSVTAAKDAETKTESQEQTGTLYLKKMADGSWKIYGGDLSGSITPVAKESAPTNESTN